MNPQPVNLDRCDNKASAPLPNPKPQVLNPKTPNTETLNPPKSLEAYTLIKPYAEKVRAGDRTARAGWNRVLSCENCGISERSRRFIVAGLCE